MFQNNQLEFEEVIINDEENTNSKTNTLILRDLS